MVQLALNQGPQDALLYDNSRSYFTNVGYTRTSNFQIEYRDVDSQSGGDFGSTLQFVIPKAADLLGPVDLMIDLPTPSAVDAAAKLTVTAEGDVAYASWVDEIGYAAIEKVTFTVGSNDIETITGEQLQIRNELMTSDEMRLGYDQIQKTGRRAFGSLHGKNGVPLTFLIDVTTATGSNSGAAKNLPSTAGVVRVLPATGAANDAIMYLSYVAAERNNNGGFKPDANPTILQRGHSFSRSDVDAMEFQVLTTAGIAAYAALSADDKLDPVKLGALGFENSGQRLTVNTAMQDCIQPHERPGNNSTLPKAYHKKYNKDYSRVIAYNSKSDPASAGTPLLQGKRQLTIPLGLFFTTHASKYFPLAAVAGCNDVRVSVKMRPIKELVQYHKLGGGTTEAMNLKLTETPKLRCHYVHVTGPEATTLMNMEHVRLMQMFQHQPHNVTMPAGVGVKDISIDLSFLHPVTCLLITVRQVQDMNTDSEGSHKSCRKGFFFYHGDGTPPNFDAQYDVTGKPVDHKRGGTVKVNNLKLTLNGQDRHPGLSNGVETDYTRSRLIPALHSNSNSDRMHLAATAKNATLTPNPNQINPEDVDYALNGSKNIMLVPFSLNPEGSNPAGAVNMSKVSHAKLSMTLEKPAPGAVDDPLTHNEPTDYIVDVHAMYWNWLQIKDGRALLSFA